MCGIAGIFSLNNRKVEIERLRQMTDVIVHRGPDGEGHWINQQGTVGLGHRRLSIIDLSETGKQPMHYMDRYTLTFNGEIYNYLELKANLVKKGYQFRSNSDTEVLLALYDLKKEACLQDLDGMFAFALYDNQTGTVFCARDRFGEKPFFYFQDNDTFYFASEMKALWAVGVPKTPNKGMVFNYLQFDLIENPNDPTETFFKGIKRLSPGSYLIWSSDEIKIRSYWNIDLEREPSNLSFDQASEKFRELFNESVSRRLRSDVLVGSSLSGGIDSSLVVCVIDQLLKESGKDIQNTFSARFRNFHKDEGKYIDYVREATRIKSHEVYSDMDLMESELDKIFYHQEEPFGSASILVQYQVYELAKKHGVTVLLDGQGADEVMAGYHFYFSTYFNELRKKSKKQFQKEFNNYAELHRDNEINLKINRPGAKDYFKSMFPGLFNQYSHKVISLRLKNNGMMKEDFFGTYRKNTYNKFEFDPSSLNEHLEFSTLKLGLPTLLRYADRNSMAHSREVRLPFLSHELVEFLFSLPSDFKIHQGWTKYIMRKSFEDILPPEIAWRKDKIGFEPPQQKWMENPKMIERIRESRRSLSKEGILESGAIDAPIHGSAANSQGDGSWAHIMVANLYEK